MKAASSTSRVLGCGGGKTACAGSGVAARGGSMGGGGVVCGIGFGGGLTASTRSLVTVSVELITQSPELALGLWFGGRGYGLRHLARLCKRAHRAECFQHGFKVARITGLRKQILREG